MEAKYPICINLDAHAWRALVYLRSLPEEVDPEQLMRAALLRAAEDRGWEDEGPPGRG